MIASQPSAIDYWMMVAIFVLLCVLTYLSLAEMALSRMTKPRAAALAEKGAKSGRALVQLAGEPTRWINPVLLCINICQTIQATLTGVIAGRLFGPAGIAIGVFCNVVVFFVLAEAVPKTYALLYPVKAATMSARPLLLLVRFWPLRMASNLLIRLTNVIVKGEGLAQGPFIAEQEFLGVIEAAAQESVIEHEERELIESVISFGDTEVKEIMVPKPDVVSIDDYITVTEALNIAVAEGFSRFPVFRAVDDHEDVIGVAYVKDLVSAERAGRGAESISGLLRGVQVVPENKLVADLMRDMQSAKIHLAMVADEYATITGLVTLEDCLEELVGEIVDEHDDEDTSVVQVDNGDYLIVGGTTLSKLNDILKTRIPDEDFDTIGGLIFGRLGRVPIVGDSVEYEGWRFSTEEMDGRRIQTVRVSTLG